MYGDHTWSGMGGGFMWVLWIVVIVVIILLFRNGSDRGKNQPSKDTPMDILRKRYASGDISEDEFERRRKVLNSDE